MVQHADIDHTGLTGIGDITAHTGDTSDAHDASAISVLDTAANFAGTDVEAVLAELQDNIDAVGGGGGEALANVFVGVGHPMLASSSAALQANRIYLAKYSPMVDVTVTNASIYINTSNGNLDFGIYNADRSSLLASTGTTASPGTGLRSIAFQSAGSVAMDAGTIYYLAMQVSSTTFRCPTWTPAAAYGTGHEVIGREDAGSMPIPSSIAAVDAWEDGFVMPLFYFT